MATPRLFAVRCLVDVTAYDVAMAGPLPDRPLGPLARVFDFYSALFKAARQRGTRSESLTAAERASADATMSLGELAFMLRDFAVLPQLVSRSELRFILGTRTLGTALRARRERVLSLKAELRAEEEAQEQDARVVEVASMRETVSQRMLARRDRIVRLRAAVDAFEKEAADESTSAPAAMSHGVTELSYPEFLEVLARVALFAFSKPQLQASDVGTTRTPTRTPRGLPVGVEAHTSHWPLRSALSVEVDTEARGTADAPASASSASPEAKISRFLRYTQLDDARATAARIQSAGAATQQLLNARPQSRGKGAFGSHAALITASASAAATELRVGGSMTDRSRPLNSKAPRAEMAPPALSASQSTSSVWESGAQYVRDSSGVPILTNYHMPAALRSGRLAASGAAGDPISPGRAPGLRAPSPKGTQSGMMTTASSGLPVGTQAVSSEAPLRHGASGHGAGEVLLVAGASLPHAKRLAASLFVHPAPEDAVTSQYSPALLALLRRYDYDDEAPIFRPYAEPAVLCGTLPLASKSLCSESLTGSMDAAIRIHPTGPGAVTEAASSNRDDLHSKVESPPGRAFRYRIVATNVSGSPISLRAHTVSLQPHIFALHVVPTAAHVPPVQVVGNAAAAAASGTPTCRKSMMMSTCASAVQAQAAASASALHDRLGSADTLQVAASEPPSPRQAQAGGKLEGPAVTVTAAAAAAPELRLPVHLDADSEPCAAALAAEVTALAPGLSLCLELRVTPPSDASVVTDSSTQSAAYLESLWDEHGSEHAGIELSAEAAAGLWQTTVVPVVANFAPAARCTPPRLPILFPGDGKGIPTDLRGGQGCSSDRSESVAGTGDHDAGKLAATQHHRATALPETSGYPDSESVAVSAAAVSAETGSKTNIMKSQALGFRAGYGPDGRRDGLGRVRPSWRPRTGTDAPTVARPRHLHDSPLQMQAPALAGSLLAVKAHRHATSVASIDIGGTSATASLDASASELEDDLPVAAALAAAATLWAETGLQTTGASAAVTGPRPLVAPSSLPASRSLPGPSESRTTSSRPRLIPSVVSQSAGPRTTSKRDQGEDAGDPRNGGDPVAGLSTTVARVAHGHGDAPATRTSTQSSLDSDSYRRSQAKAASGHDAGHHRHRDGDGDDGHWQAPGLICDGWERAHPHYAFPSRGGLRLRLRRRL